MSARDHKAVLQSIAPEVRGALHDVSGAAGVVHLAFYLAAMIGTGAWVLLALPLWQVGLMVHGVLLVFLFTIQHECTHDTPFASQRMCRVVGHLCGFVLIQPFTWFRYFHLAHHRHTNDPLRDPELLSGAKPEGWKAYLRHVSGIPVWSGLMKVVLQNSFGDPRAPYLPERAVPRVRREARVMLAGYGLAGLSFLWTDALLWLWLLPMAVAQPVLRLYLLAEHGRCPQVANMLENTRTTFTNRLVRFVAWNMPYHIEHHSAPNVPFHKLPQLHDLMRENLISTSPSYRAFTKDYVSEFT